MLDFSSLNSTIAAESQKEALELEFIFSPDSLDALSGGPRPRHGKHKPYRNPNRPGTPLAFWRDVKDVLRLMTFNRRQGSYVAPGNGSRNNIEREPTPTGAGNPPILHGGGIAQIPTRRPHLDVPPLPPFDLPGSLPQPMEPVPIATRLPPAHFKFKDKYVTLTPDKPISYKQELLFIGGTAIFVNRAQAQAVMRELLEIMLEHKDVHVTIIGNACDDFQLKGAFTMPYGSNKALLMRAPLGGWYRSTTRGEITVERMWGKKYATMGAFMLARAQAIGNLLISRGVPSSRVHCEIGSYGYGQMDNPNSSALKRRATIVISQKP